MSRTTITQTTSESTTHLSSLWDPSWRQRANCTNRTELFLAPGNANRLAEAKALCKSCSVRTECLALALDSNATYGIFAGTTPQWRMALLRRRPTVRSWRELLTRARAEHERHCATADASVDGSEAARTVPAADAPR
ncbi:WhiB family transcriptional regulator [Streptomyces vinaceus]|uniref:WhiB family transcriptional regulator n=1 Tax=Streptomyces vinaceus TaxID=1960 RepID=UPI0036A6E0DB